MPTSPRTPSDDQAILSILEDIHTDMDRLTTATAALHAIVVEQSHTLDRVMTALDDMHDHIVDTLRLPPAPGDQKT